MFDKQERRRREEQISYHDRQYTAAISRQNVFDGEFDVETPMFKELNDRVRFHRLQRDLWKAHLGRFDEQVLEKQKLMRRAS